MCNKSQYCHAVFWNKATVSQIAPCTNVQNSLVAVLLVCSILNASNVVGSGSTFDRNTSNS